LYGGPGEAPAAEKRKKKKSKKSKNKSATDDASSRSVGPTDIPDPEV